MFVLHLKLENYLKSHPVHFGSTADTGDHTDYVFDTKTKKSKYLEVNLISIVRKLFENDSRGVRLCPKPSAHDLEVDDRSGFDTLSELPGKEALIRDLQAFCRHLAALPQLPDVIHAHFADAAAVALMAKARFHIPVVYTPHALGLQRRGDTSPAMDQRIASEREAIAAADTIIVSSHDEAKTQIRAYGVEATAPVHRMPPGVPQQQAPAAQADIIARLGAWLDDPAKPTVLAMARPVRKENRAALVRAYVARPALMARANRVILAGQNGGYHGSTGGRQVIADAHGVRPA